MHHFPLLLDIKSLSHENEGQHFVLTAFIFLPRFHPPPTTFPSSKNKPCIESLSPLLHSPFILLHPFFLSLFHFPDFSSHFQSLVKSAVLWTITLFFSFTLSFSLTLTGSFVTCGFNYHRQKHTPAAVGFSRAQNEDNSLKEAMNCDKLKRKIPL